MLKTIEFTKAALTEHTSKAVATRIQEDKADENLSKFHSAFLTLRDLTPAFVPFTPGGTPPKFTVGKVLEFITDLENVTAADIAATLGVLEQEVREQYASNYNKDQADSYAFGKCVGGRAGGRENVDGRARQ